MRTVWLASYPKSGNTWFRIFISNLLYPDKAPVDPNNLPLNNLLASARAPVHEITGVPPSLLTADEVDSLRPEVDEIIGQDWAGPLCLRKVHDAYTYLPNGRPLLGAGPNFAAIYILRDPWDVAVSVANHYGRTLEQAVTMLCSDSSSLDNRKDRSTSQLRQRLLSWSGHVSSWLSAPMEVCLIRYEQMHSNPLTTFRRALTFLEISASDDEISDAIQASSFSRLQKLEQERGFREAPKDRRFFRAGRVGEGRNLLSPKLAENILKQSALVDHFLKQGAEKLL